MMRKTLIFGAVALGGYLAKQYWDKKKEAERIDKNALYDYGCEIYNIKQFCRLKSSRHKTHKIVANLAEKIGALGDFGESLGLLKSYSTHNELDLDGFIALDKNEANKVAIIFPMVGFLDRVCEELKAKEMWLNEIAQSVGESRESNLSESNSNKSDSGESHESKSPESSGKSLSAQIKSEITALVEIIKGIHAIITGDFTSEPYDKLVEARELLVALKSHPSGGQL